MSLRDRFKLLVHESNAQKYEDLFVKIMRYADASFKPVKAHGNIGDRGCDGWCANEGKYYQVYAPEDLSNSDNAAIKKMESDFEKLLSYWNRISPVQQYIFVVNDKYNGVSPRIYEAIKNLKGRKKLNNADVLLAADLERLLFEQRQDVIDSVLGGSIGCNKKSIYEHLVEELTEKLYLRCWSGISDNLIADSVQADVVNGFSGASLVVFKTVMPNAIPSLESSIKDLICRADALRLHFTDSEFSYLSEDNRWWRRDMRWRKIWMDNQDDYHRKFELYECWSRQLFDLHCNFVYALNIFSFEVRIHIDANYFMGQQFTVVDSLGVYNGLYGYEAIPSGYREIN